MQVPSTPIASAQEGQRIAVEWGAVSGAATYRVRISINGAAWQSEEPFSNSSEIFSVEFGNSYQYSVQACHANGQCSIWSSASNSITVPAPTPVVQRFEWLPARVTVGTNQSFYWDVEHVESCYSITAPNTPGARPPSGSFGPFTKSEPEVSITKWYCIDLAGNRYPANPDTYLEATRTVVAAAPQPVVNRFEWQPLSVSVGTNQSFYWDVQHVESCYSITAPNTPGARPPSGSFGPFTKSEPEVSITKWYCTDLAGNRFPSDPNSFLEATRTVIPPGQETEKVITYLHTDILGSIIAESDSDGNIIKKTEYKPFGKKKD
ncbi:hypothetical protein WG68_06525 [Arsukibacterium ikkense]|uniref:Fibronectin type-III domain-containing protein n=2 Tax=Arsukibacterium ikkense TaxID=336831 RepID=A0A0M2V7L0_9GAMM|nr:hypothetical protein WG68_06525 [Arsukibacterium ikkense]